MPGRLRLLRLLWLCVSRISISVVTVCITIEEKINIRMQSQEGKKSNKKKSKNALLCLIICWGVADVVVGRIAGSEHASPACYQMEKRL